MEKLGEMAFKKVPNWQKTNVQIQEAWRTANRTYSKETHDQTYHSQIPEA